MSRPAPEVVTPYLLRGWPLPDLQADKESRGRVLVVGGSRQNPGGVLLAAEAALRAGAGKVQVVTTASTAVALAVAMPEVWVGGAAETGDGELAVEAAEIVAELAPACEAVVVGPGLGDPAQAADLVGRLLPGLTGPVVLDALALTAVTRDPTCLSGLDGGAGAVLTPNLHELSMTLGWDEVKVREDPREAALRLAARTGATVTSGSEVTWVAHPDGRSWRVEVGGPGLGTAGSGDTKSGVVAGLCARGVEPVQAAVWGSYLHGSAGDRMAAALGSTGYLAREVVAQVPVVLAELQV